MGEGHVYYCSFHADLEIKITSQSHFPSSPVLGSLLSGNLEDAITLVLSYQGNLVMSMEGFDSWLASEAEIIQEITIDDFSLNS